MKIHWFTSKHLPTHWIIVSWYYWWSQNYSAFKFKQTKQLRLINQNFFQSYNQFTYHQRSIKSPPLIELVRLNRRDQHITCRWNYLITPDDWSFTEFFFFFSFLLWKQREKGSFSLYLKHNSMKLTMINYLELKFIWSYFGHTNALASKEAPADERDLAVK